jgi:hypothetical protein
MTEAEMIEREVDERLAAEMEARRAAIRLEVADRMRREAFQARMAKINAPHAVELPRTPEIQRAYDAQADASHAAMLEKLAKNSERFAALEQARAKGEQAMPRMRLPGNPNDEGFAIKR